MSSSLGIWIVRAGAEKLGRHLEESLWRQTLRFGNRQEQAQPRGVRDILRRLSPMDSCHDHGYRRSLLARVANRQNDRSRDRGP